MLAFKERHRRTGIGMLASGLAFIILGLVFVAVSGLSASTPEG